MRGFRCVDDLRAVVRSRSDDEQIVRKRTRSSAELRHDEHPGPHHERDEHHRQWASLGDAIGREVGVADAERKRVVYAKVFLVTSVRSKDTRWYPRYLGDMVEQRTRDFVKTFIVILTNDFLPSVKVSLANKLLGSNVSVSPVIC